MRNQKSKANGILNRIYFVVINIAIFAALIAPTTSAQTQVNIPAGKDNTLYEISNAVASNGAGEHFFAGRTARGERRRGLLFFDLADKIPAGAIVDSVRLKLHMSRTNSGAQFIKLYRLSAGWGEGTSNATTEEGGGATPTPGDATWIHRFFNTALWTSSGGDFTAVASDSQAVSATGFYTWGSTPRMVNDVQTWLNTPSNNFGWLLMGNEVASFNTKRFDTRENSDPTFRPVLTVNYTVAVGVESDFNPPIAFALREAFPNPLSLSASTIATRIRYDLPRATPVKLIVYNLLGEEIRTLVNAPQTAGSKQIIWDGANGAGVKVASGVYLYRIEAGAFTAARELTVIK